MFGWLKKLRRTPPPPQKKEREFAPTQEQVESFMTAFSDMGAGCVRGCYCGRVFYNSDGGWTWEEGELEAYQNDPNATDLGWAVGMIMFEGREYVPDCDCWRKRAATIPWFIISHRAGLTKFLNLERERQLKAAKQVAEVRS